MKVKRENNCKCKTTEVKHKFVFIKCQPFLFQFNFSSISIFFYTNVFFSVSLLLINWLPLQFPPPTSSWRSNPVRLGCWTVRQTFMSSCYNPTPSKTPILKWDKHKMPLPVQVFNFQVSLKCCLKCFFFFFVAKTAGNSATLASV